MADGTTTSTPSTGGLNFADYQKKIGELAAKTRKVSGTDVPESVTKLVSRTPGRTTDAFGVPSRSSGDSSRALGEAAISQFTGEAEAMKTQAEKAASGLEMMGEQTEQFMSNLEGIRGRLEAQTAKAQETWGAAAEKADEYVQAARSRVGEVLGKIDEINEQIGKDRDFSKAHAMQSAVQATLGTMKAEERNILENYGTESKEYQQFVASKKVALATVQSNIHASYQQLAERQDQAYMNATVEGMTKSNMYLGFQEQQHVEMLKYKESAAQAYNLQVAQFQTGIEQMKMAGMENLANWMIETPSFTMDMTPLVTLLSDLFPTEQERSFSRTIVREPQRGSNLPYEYARKPTASRGTK